MPNSYFIDTSRDFKAHGLKEWRVFGPSKITEELRKSIDILSERLKTEKQLNERLDRENKQWEGDVDKLQKNLAISENNLEATELSLKVSKQEIVALKRKCEECDGAIDLLREERSNLKSTIKAFMRKNDMYLNEVERRREENAALLKNCKSCQEA